MIAPPGYDPVTDAFAADSVGHDPTTYVCCLFGSQPGMPKWSEFYHEGWVDKLYRGIARNTADPAPHVVCLTDRKYDFKEPVWQVGLRNPDAGFGCLAEAWRDDFTERKVCVLGLDTIITGDIDHIVQTPCKIGLLEDPYAKGQIGNMVGLYSRESCDLLWNLWHKVQDEHPGVFNDQQFLRNYVGLENVAVLNRIYPGQILSYKVEVKGRSEPRQKPSIVYFHGNPKPNEINVPWLDSHWI